VTRCRGFRRAAAVGGGARSVTKGWWWRTAVAAASGLLLCLGAVRWAWAAAPAAARGCSERVLIAVDDSGSTFPNPTTGYPGTDPGDLRGRAALAAAQLLLARRACPAVVSAVAFGTDVDVLSTGFRTRVPAAVAAVWLHPRDLDWTNTVGVLQAASVLLAGRGAKALLLITDGYPEMPGVSDAAMRGDFSRAARRLARAGVALDVLLLQGRGSASGGAFAAWQPVWERATAASGGAFQVVAGAEQLPGAVDAVVGAIEEQAGGHIRVHPRLLLTPATLGTGPLGAAVRSLLVAVTAGEAVRVTGSCPGAAPVVASFPGGSGVLRLAHPQAGACRVQVVGPASGLPVTVGTVVQAPAPLPEARLPWSWAAAALLLAGLLVGGYRLLVGGTLLVPARLSQHGQVLINVEGLPRAGWKRLRSPAAVVLGDRPGADFGLAHAPSGAWLAVRRQGRGVLQVRGPGVRLPSGAVARRWTTVPPVVDLVLVGARGGGDAPYTLECTEAERGVAE
jgi:hypothetical protein